MLNCSVGTRTGKRELKKWSRQRDGIFALVAGFRAAVREQQDRRVLRETLDLIIRTLREQSAVEERLLRGQPGFSPQVHEQSYADIVAELQEFLDLASSEDEPLSDFAHALDGVVIHEVRGEFRLLS